nr:hypothetical protein [Rhizobium halophilum]
MRLKQARDARCTDSSTPVKTRVVLHCPGFEPLDSRDHHARYKRSAAQSGRTWGLDVAVGEFVQDRLSACFDVSCQDGLHVTKSRIYILDHFSLVAALTEKSIWKQTHSGYISAARVVWEGGMVSYFRHAWRFGLFFLFPFLLMTSVVAVCALTALLPALLYSEPLNYLWSLPCALALLKFVLPPLLEKFHTLHLFADWTLAIAIARLDNREVNSWMVTCRANAREALKEAADEYVTSSHSMGSAIAAYVIGTLLDEDPDLFRGKRVVFVTLGGAILQCSLMKSATTLRACVGRIARAEDVFWLEIQCLTDSIHFYKSRVVSLAGHPDAKQASIEFIRVKRLVSAERYRRIKRDFLRVHRQYVLGSDRRSNFDFTVMTAGPLPASLGGKYAPIDDAARKSTPNAPTGIRK